ncbi:hypothetical protein EGW08_020668 [Elysia chlorotica]|uniref:Uncharacterized protein n=1 Tax=Elysia chlorotica TaxID=188477 RepID=A0A3S0ZC57_ELYCH|nr:hypothetical protein EGW08_020668 [Elysia chlorotica]
MLSKLYFSLSSLGLSFPSLYSALLYVPLNLLSHCPATPQPTPRTPPLLSLSLLLGLSLHFRSLLNTGMSFFIPLFSIFRFYPPLLPLSLSLRFFCFFFGLSLFSYSV